MKANKKEQKMWGKKMKTKFIILILVLLSNFSIFANISDYVTLSDFSGATYLIEDNGEYKIPNLIIEESIGNKAYNIEQYFIDKVDDSQRVVSFRKEIFDNEKNIKSHEKIKIEYFEDGMIKTMSCRIDSIDENGEVIEGEFKMLEDMEIALKISEGLLDKINLLAETLKSPVYIKYFQKNGVSMKCIHYELRNSLGGLIGYKDIVSKWNANDEIYVTIYEKIENNLAFADDGSLMSSEKEVTLFANGFRPMNNIEIMAS
ncbi:hypothetical protein BVX93_01425 [bacterium B13(2017)]|nr:hypothetical protein BVX93_01425 [bacterium B13(2017)]